MKEVNKKVLIVTYYWPPSGGGGVQRWVKFVKYLKDFGWEPIVYTPENPDYPFIDESLSKEVSDDLKVVRTKIWEPYNIYNKLAGSKKEDKTNAGLISSDNNTKSFKQEMLLWVRGNLFIPDARKFWIKPSVKFLKKYCKENNISYVITSGPPHSMHIIGLKLKRAINIKWIADFRDPWLYMDNNINDLKYTKRTFNKHQKLESNTLREADQIITVSEQIAKDYQDISKSNIEIITNGFDVSDFNIDYSPTDFFVIGHYGTLGKYRCPDKLWKVLGDKIKADKEFKELLRIELIGPVDYSVFESLNNQGLNKNLIKVDYLSHSEVVKKMINASVLLLLLDKNFSMKGRMTGKIFEYLAAKRPILGMGEIDSDPVKVLKETNTGEMIDYEDEDGLIDFVNVSFEKFKKNELFINSEGYLKYSRKELTRHLANILDAL